MFDGYMVKISLYLHNLGSRRLGMGSRGNVMVGMIGRMDRGGLGMLCGFITRR